MTDTLTPESIGPVDIAIALLPGQADKAKILA